MLAEGKHTHRKAAQLESTGAPMADSRWLEPIPYRNGSHVMGNHDKLLYVLNPNSVQGLNPKESLRLLIETKNWNFPQQNHNPRG